MSNHPAFLLGQALEALTAISGATDLGAAQAEASQVLEVIIPADADFPAVLRGMHRWQRERDEAVRRG